MKTPEFTIQAKVWLYKGDSPWHFVTIDKETGTDMKNEFIWPRRGFGAIPVVVRIGKTEWNTSIFPEKEGTYLLPIKKAVREKENILEGSSINVSLKVII